MRILARILRRMSLRLVVGGFLAVGAAAGAMAQDDVGSAILVTSSVPGLAAPALLPLDERVAVGAGEGLTLLHPETLTTLDIPGPREGTVSELIGLGGRLQVPFNELYQTIRENFLGDGENAPAAARSATVEVDGWPYVFAGTPSDPQLHCYDGSRPSMRLPSGAEQSLQLRIQTVGGQPMSAPANGYATVGGRDALAFPGAPSSGQTYEISGLGAPGVLYLRLRQVPRRTLREGPERFARLVLAGCVAQARASVER